MSSKNKTTDTKEEARLALVPKLRFPEFREADAWEPTTIGALGRFYYGKSAPKWSLAEDAPTPCVRYGELYTKFGPVITETYSRTNTDPETLKFSKGGEILIPRVGERPEDFGKCCAYLPLKGIAIGEMISVLETKQHPLFYTYYFRNLYKQFAKVVEGQNVKNLYFTELEPLPIHRPSIPEQQKIAECLSSVDELLAAQTRKVDALKTYKKGLMQHLFPREGETHPRLRFPEFQNAGEWEPKTLGSVCNSYSGGTPSTSKPEYYGGDIPFIRSAEIARDSTELFLTSEGLANSAAKMVTSGDVLVALYGANSGDVALARIDGAINQAILCLKSKESNSFIYQFLSFKKEWIVATYLQGGQGNLSGEIVKSIAIGFPSPAEQQRIATCLSSLDALIAAETQKLEALKAHKRGLMQQVFPIHGEG